MIPIVRGSAAGNKSSSVSGGGGAPLSHVSGHEWDELLGDLSTVGCLRRLIKYMSVRVIPIKTDRTGRR